jgi:hypothetical protein
MITFGLLFLQPKFGGKIIDIVSGDTETPEQKAEGLRAVNSTILEIFLVVIVGYGWWCYPCLFLVFCFIIVKGLPRPVASQIDNLLNSASLSYYRQILS